MKIAKTGESFADHINPSLASFAALGLDAKIVRATEDAGYTTPSEIQALAIPVVLQKKDIIAQAQTGSGKTAAFVLPAIQQLKFNKKNEVLVLVPTRELAEQVMKEVERFGRSLGVASAVVIGGKPYLKQIDDLNRGAQIVVATPGRLLDHLTSGRLTKFQPELVVLDEADEILNMGFIDEVKKILSLVPPARQLLLFSATMPPPIVALAKKELKEPVHICLVKKENNDRHENIQQSLYVVKENERENALVRLIFSENPHKAIVFCRTKSDVDQLCYRLNESGVQARALHGDLAQSERQKVTQSIKVGNLKILIATDIASRGLDISDLSHVINYHLPESPERYVHRIGRTGRAGKDGKALTIVSEREWRSNYFFRSPTSKNMKFASLPSRAHLEEAFVLSMLADIKQIEITPAAKKLCDENFKDPKEAFDMLCRLLSEKQNEMRIAGPENIGFSVEEMQNISRNNRGTSSGRDAGGGRGRSFSRSRSNAQPSRGRGGYNRSRS